MSLSAHLETAEQTTTFAMQLPQDEEDLPRSSAGGRSAPTLPPHAEHACVLRLSRLCHELLEALPSPRTPHSAARPGSCMTIDATSSCSVDNLGTACSPVVTGCVEGAAASVFTEAERACESATASEAVPHNVQAVGGRNLPAHLVDCESQNSAPVWQESWRSRTHMQMAESYCIQRSLLLQRIAADLECQALLVSGGLSSPVQNSIEKR